MSQAKGAPTAFCGLAGKVQGCAGCARCAESRQLQQKLSPVYFIFGIYSVYKVQNQERSDEYGAVHLPRPWQILVHNQVTSMALESIITIPQQ